MKNPSSLEFYKLSDVGLPGSFSDDLSSEPKASTTTKKQVRLEFILLSVLSPVLISGGCVEECMTTAANNFLSHSPSLQGFALQGFPEPEAASLGFCPKSCQRLPGWCYTQRD